MIRLIMLALAVTCGVAGCSKSEQAPATPTTEDMATAESQNIAGFPAEQTAHDKTVSQNVGVPLSNAKPAVADNGTDNLSRADLIAPSYLGTDRSAELDNVFEALFRHQFQHNASGDQQEAAAYFLSIKNSDPSPEFMKRFCGHTPPVTNGSEFQTGKGLNFRIDSWQWKSDNEIELTGGYYEAGTSSSGNRYVLARKDGQWVVESDEMEWIS